MNKTLVEPIVYTLNDMITYAGMKSLSKERDVMPDVYHTPIGEVEGLGIVGLYFMNPNAQSIVFSMEDKDDGTADEYYGPCHEFYYILAGEFTMFWGKDVSEVRKGKANKLHLRPGEMGYWSPGWKYSVKNTSKMPGTFFWGISRPPKGIVQRKEVAPPLHKS